MTTSHDANRPPGLLIVDPDPRPRDALARRMQEHGWQVWSSADGAGALDLFRRHRDRLDVALVDLQLPGLQGARVLAELGRLDAALARCAMSADVTPYTAAAFRRLTDTPLFAKPIDAPALSFALHGLIAVAARA